MLFGIDEDDRRNSEQWHTDDIGAMIGAMRKEDFPEDIVDKEYRADGESAAGEGAPKLEVLGRNRSRSERKTLKKVTERWCDGRNAKRIKIAK